MSRRVTYFLHNLMRRDLMDLRYARTLTGGDNVGLIEIYDCSREELRIGPFSYEPMRAVDFWLQQNDEFLLNLSSAPDVAPPSFVQLVRSTLKRIKDDPYPAVTIFNTNSPRYYRNDTVSGHWIRVYHKEDASNGSASNTAAIAAAAAGWPPP